MNASFAFLQSLGEACWRSRSKNVNLDQENLMQQGCPAMRLPPLNSLKAFEASVRLGGFTAAASELGVSPAAVSMQVKKAEDFLGKTLFRRTNNSLHLTDAGRYYYPTISDALMSISVATDQLLENEARSRIVISTIQSLAEKWVAPAVSRFRSIHPDIGLELRIESDPVDLLRTQTDIRVTSEGHLYPQHISVPLFTDSVFPYFTEQFQKQNLVKEDLTKAPDNLLIHTDWGEQYASYPTWSAWFRAAGTARTPDVRKGLRVGGAAVAFALASQGAGVALVPKMVISAQSGSEPYPQSEWPGLPLPYAFVAILPKHAAPPHENRRKAALVQALLSNLTQIDEQT
ncbi:LysR family transcriptional regulator [Ruegeria sp. Ofav3-42]|uniref:LysR family transcriptional regulator n=1 Tax=Ruegeria sp. Ofav3-42 TaxID=2917759 RepID=UPI001EF44EB8|nr:LysR family transcriptional regulator [Ruegeria sp. Ofav3-42]MCG7521409.1 LysR family transcriptional regulator [Ruegeria sp. Ofav3-42]